MTIPITKIMIVKCNHIMYSISCTWDGVIVNGGEDPLYALDQLSELAASKYINSYVIKTFELSNENLHVFIIRKSKHL